MSRPGDILFTEGDTLPPTPTTGKILFYAKTDDNFYKMNSLGVETPVGGGSTDTAIDGGEPNSNYGGITPINGGTP